MNPALGLLITAISGTGGGLVGLRVAKVILARRGPECDHCGQKTGKPYLYKMPAVWWRCNLCEDTVTRMLYQEAAAGRDITELLRRTTSNPPDRGDR